MSSLAASLRSRDGAVLAGVCSRLGRRWGIDPLLLRIAFIATAFAGGGGLIAYGILAVVMPSRIGPGVALRRGRSTWRIAAGVGLLVLSALLTLRAAGLWFSDAVVWPLALGSSGVALLWRQSALPSPARPTRNPRTLLGIGLIVGGGIVFLSATDAISGLGNLLVATIVVFAGTALVFGPWWVRVSQALTAERAARIRSQERAEVAAHLHDSVLQTLALIQRRAGDPAEVAQLARAQERDLRAWLNEHETAPGAELGAALRAAAAEVEQLHGVPVEVVVVGEAPITQDLTALVAAAREAMANAARWSGAEKVDVYAEVADERVSVFVRDRGAGFDRGAVPEDRRGVRESIEGRMARHGGTGRIQTAPGAGTEVELEMPRR